MKVFITMLVIFISHNTYSQEYYFIDAKNGLNVRSQGNLSSKKVAKIRYGAIVEKIEDTDEILTISDNHELIKGKFVKIKYREDYLIEEEVEGYVFDGYLKKQTTVDILSITKIEKEKYIELSKRVFKENDKPNKISDLDSIKSILTDRVDWFTNIDEVNIIKAITLNNGQKLSFDRSVVDFGFTENSRYYPAHDILVLEGGHASDVCFSIKTGENQLTIGNPDYIISSPKNSYRLNGYFGGQECISYFFQKNKNGDFEYLTSLNLDYDICTFKEFNWVSENEFIYIKINYEKDSEDGVEEHFKGKINNSKIGDYNVSNSTIKVTEEVDSKHMEKAHIRKDNSIWLSANMKKDHRIFGYEKKNINSKKMILLSIFTNEVENNPFDCKYGAFYDTSEMTDLKLYYVTTENDFFKIKVVKKEKTIGEVYMLKKWFILE